MTAPAPLPVVFVPGLGLTAAAVDPVRRRLRLPSRVVTLPGYGEPAPAGTDLAPPALADRVLRAVGDDPALDRFVLVGHSASGQIVTEVAVRRPDRVAGLVLIAPTTDPRAAGWPALVGRWLRTAVHERVGELPLLVRCYATTGLPSMYRGMAAARRHRVEAVLPAVAAPTWVLRGGHDRISPADWIVRCAGLAGGSALSLSGGAHMIVLTHPAQVAGAIEAVAVRAGASRPS